ncbi:hypothetical protein EG68_02791 [Paragonimus skrjabini miyazakii]|uniref:C3H1-type domain-containing protein n=1 Tax=Paragonimus skrjabini miyazakii TaxID=59628 RepID=A0A8S9Z1Y6_9TREM|nr:hypothetical protein EG68_02791 [Paragonimus skrjabini miyazakii]
MSTLDADNMAYRPEDCFSLLVNGSDFEDLSFVEAVHSDADSVDDYPLSPVLETFFGRIPAPTCTQSEVLNVFSNNTYSVPNFSTHTSNCFNGRVNLDDVPMELVTSEEELLDTECGVVDDHSSSKDNKLLSEVSKLPDRTSELDEIELRSRALRSLLLKRQSGKEPFDKDTEPHTQMSEQLNDAAPDEKSHITVKLSIGSGRNISHTGLQQRFVIPLCDSSDNEDCSSASPPVRVTTSQSSLLSVRAQSQRIAAAVAHKPDIEKSSSVVDRVGLAESHLLQRKMNLLRLKLTVKRQQRIVDERRKLVRKLFQTLTDLRRRLKRASLLYKQATKSLMKTEHTHVLHQKKLALAQRHYAHMCATLRQMDSNISSMDCTQSASGPSTLPVKSELCLLPDSQRKELILNSLSILRCARINTAYFAYFQFNPHQAVSKRTTRPYDADHWFPKTAAASVNSETLQRVDPTVPLCPFLVDGECKDDDCMFQHPDVLRKPEKGQLQTVALSRIPHASQVTNAAETCLEDATCIFCKHCASPVSVDLNKVAHLHKWHTIYMAYNRSRTKVSLEEFKSFCSSSLEMLRASPDCFELAAHHLAMVCSRFKLAETEDILDGLKAVCFSPTACRLVLRHPCLSGNARRLIARASIDWLMPQLQQPPHLSDFLSPLSASFVYIVYHLVLLYIESESPTTADHLLNEFLTVLPKAHPARYGLWWLKLSVALCQQFPSEGVLSSLVNMPALTKASLLANQDLVKQATTDLNIPSNSVSLLDSLSEVNGHCILLSCYAAVVYIYVQTLLTKQQYQTAIDLCLRISTTHAMHLSDDLFFPTAIFALCGTNASLDWSSLIHSLCESSRSRMTVSFQIEFHFLLAMIAWKRNLFTVCRSVLVESLAGLIFLPSDNDAEVLGTFKEFLGTPGTSSQPDSLLELLCPRGQTYLWLSYGLFSLISSSDLEFTLQNLISYYRSHQTDSSSIDGNEFLFDRLILHMIILLITRVSDSSHPSVYMTNVAAILLDRPLALDRLSLPSWFIELIQRINLAPLSSPGVRHDLCVRLVETYGPQLIPSFCRSLFALGDRFLAQSLCAIGRLDEPDQVDFWLLYASIVVSDASNSQRQKVTLTEVFADAVSAIPSSRVLWRHYALAAQASKASVETIVRSAKELHMLDAVTGIIPISEQKPSINVPPPSARPARFKSTNARRARRNARKNKPKTSATRFPTAAIFKYRFDTIKN